MKRILIVLTLLAASSVASVFAMDRMDRAIEAKRVRDLASDVEKEMNLEMADSADGSVTPQTAYKARLIEDLCVVTGQQKAATRLHKKKGGIEKTRHIRENREIKKPAAQRPLNFEDDTSFE